MRYAEETEDPLLIAAATWSLGQAMYADDMPHGALHVAMTGAEKLRPLLPDGTPAHFAAYGGLQQVAAISAVRLEDPWRARELLRGPAREAAATIGEGRNDVSIHLCHERRGDLYLHQAPLCVRDTSEWTRNDHHIVFGPTNVRIHMVHVEQQVGEISDALRLADEVDITKIPSLERKTTHLYELARCYDYRNNDTAVFVHLKMAERLCPQDFRYKHNVRSMVSTLGLSSAPSLPTPRRYGSSRHGSVCWTRSSRSTN